jgi:peptidoglycan/LPS O-acetylase OafA/YrhL
VNNLLLHIGFLHYTTPYSSASLSINGPLWTLALELQYYLLLPLIALAFVRRPYATAVLLIALTAAWRILAAFDLDPLIAIYERIGRRWDIPETTLRQLATTQLPGYLGHFALGVLCGRAWLLTRDHRMKFTEACLLAALLVGSLLGLYALFANAYPVQGERTWLLVPALMALAMWASVSMRPPWGTRMLGFMPLALVGRISYSMYLYHLPALLLFNKYAPADLGIAAFPGYFVGIVAVSTLSFHYIERPFMQRVGKRVGELPPPTSTQSNSITTG